MGASYTSATELLQLDLDGDVRFRRPKFEATATASAVADPAAGGGRHPAELARPRYTRLFSNRHRLFAQATVEQNQRARLRRARAAWWEAGRTLLAPQRPQRAHGRGRPALNREKPVEGETTTNVEAVAGFDFANFAYDFPNTDIQVTAFAYLGLSQWGRIRLESSASLRRELFSDFYFGLKGYESYDSEPATESAQKNDWGLSLSLGYSF